MMIGLGLETILTEGVTLAVTVIVIELDVAGEPVAQLNDEVMITVTTSPLTKAEEVKVDEVAPAFAPLICH